MTIKIEIYFKDLTPKVQAQLLEEFKTTEEDENWDTFPLAIVEREVEDLYP